MYPLSILANFDQHFNVLGLGVVRILELQMLNLALLPPLSKTLVSGSYFFFVIYCNPD